MSKAIILVAFGTTDEDGIKQISDFSRKIKTHFNNEYIVDFAFSSKTLIKIVNKRYNLGIRDIEESLFKLVEDGVSEVYLQPLHFMEGKNQEELAKILDCYKHLFKIIVLGTPLLTKNKKSIGKLIEALKDEIKKEEEVLLIGHGSKSGNDNYYEEIELQLRNQGYKALVGTLEGKVGKIEILEKIKEKGWNSVKLYPLLIIAGKHMKEDFVGENSWEEYLEENNIKVEVIEKSLLEYDGIAKEYLSLCKGMINGII